MKLLKISLGMYIRTRPVASYIRVVGPWKNFRLLCLHDASPLRFALQVQKFTVFTDSNHSCFVFLFLQRNALETKYWMVEGKNMKS